MFGLVKRPYFTIRALFFIASFARGVFFICGFYGLKAFFAFDFLLFQLKILKNFIFKNPRALFLVYVKNSKTKIMKKAILLFALALGSTFAMKAQSKDPMVGGAAMYPTKDIIENAVKSKDHTTLVAAVKAAGLVPTLKSKGPFTVFAPTNEAFEKLPAGTVETLLKPENKAKSSSILTYHVVAGKVSAKKLIGMIKKGNGKAEIKTVQGGILTASLEGGKVKLTDENGGTAFVTIANVFQSNGVIHVIDGVLTPKM